MTPTTQSVVVPVDDLAQEIRRVDGNHDLGAGALAEALVPFLSDRLAAAPTPSSLADGERYRQEAETLAEVLRSRGRNNSKHDINRAANLLDLLAALSPEAPAREGVSSSLLHKAGDRPKDCHCPPDRCGAPRIMGRQMPCLRNEAAITPPP